MVIIFIGTAKITHNFVQKKVQGIFAHVVSLIFWNQSEANNKDKWRS